MRGYVSLQASSGRASFSDAWRPAFGVGAVAAALLAGPAAAQDKPAEIIAAHIRTQGYACDKALSAQRNRKASRPNETVWLLRCSNGIYNVTLVPDLAAKVVLVKDEKQN